MDFKAIEKHIVEHKEQIISLLLDCVMTDTILFWSEDKALQNLQKQQWLPMINMFNKETVTDFSATYGLNTLAENEKNKPILKAYFNTLNNKELSALYAAAESMKSVLLGLLLSKNKITHSEAFNTAFLEELYQNTIWGEEEQSLESRKQIKKDLYEIEEYLKNG